MASRAGGTKLTLTVTGKRGRESAATAGGGAPVVLKPKNNRELVNAHITQNEEPWCRAFWVGYDDVLDMYEVEDPDDQKHYFVDKGGLAMITRAPFKSIPVGTRVVAQWLDGDVYTSVFYPGVIRMTDQLREKDPDFGEIRRRYLVGFASGEEQWVPEHRVYVPPADVPRSLTAEEAAVERSQRKRVKAAASVASAAPAPASAAPGGGAVPVRRVPLGAAPSEPDDALDVGSAADLVPQPGAPAVRPLVPDATPALAMGPPPPATPATTATATATVATPAPVAIRALLLPDADTQTVTGTAFSASVRSSPPPASEALGPLAASAASAGAAGAAAVPAPAAAPVPVAELTPEQRAAAEAEELAKLKRLSLYGNHVWFVPDAGPVDSDSESGTAGPQAGHTSPPHVGGFTGWYESAAGWRRYTQAYSLQHLNFVVAPYVVRW